METIIFDTLTDTIVSDIIKAVSSESLILPKYKSIYTKEYLDPLCFDISVFMRRGPSINLANDKEFKNLPWEIDNFNKDGFSINANAYLNKSEHVVPEITVMILADSNKSSSMFYKLQDVIRHELEHLVQIGWNRTKAGAQPSSASVRKKANTNYRYFLLKDEIPAMVAGMSRRAKLQNVPIEEIFSEYLQPLLNHNFITNRQYSIVMEAWLKYFNSNYTT